MQQLNSYSITQNHLRTAMALAQFDSASAQERMAPTPRGILSENLDTPPREAGVLALIFPEPGDGLHIVLTRRTESLRGHSGQISLPGGKCDPEDQSVTHTALRETCEELGICSDDIEVLGMLKRFYIPPSHFMVYPTVAAMKSKPEFRPNPAEVAEVFSFPLYHLVDSRHKHHEYHVYQNIRVRIPYYLVNSHKVWGATAVMLSELEQRLRAIL